MLYRIGMTNVWEKKRIYIKKIVMFKHNSTIYHPQFINLLSLSQERKNIHFLSYKYKKNRNYFLSFLPTWRQVRDYVLSLNIFRSFALSLLRMRDYDFGRKPHSFFNKEFHELDLWYIDFFFSLFSAYVNEN